MTRSRMTGKMLLMMSLTILMLIFFYEKKRQQQTFFSRFKMCFIFSLNDNDDNKVGVTSSPLKFLYNFKRFLACMILLTTRSVMVFLPGKRSWL